MEQLFASLPLSRLKNAATATTHIIRAAQLGINKCRWKIHRILLLSTSYVIHSYNAISISKATSRFFPSYILYIYKSVTRARALRMRRELHFHLYDDKSSGAKKDAAVVFLPSSSKKKYFIRIYTSIRSESRLLLFFSPRRKEAGEERKYLQAEGDGNFLSH